MKKARIRALIHAVVDAFEAVCFGGNEKSPYKGIDTSASGYFSFILYCRNEKSPYKGIDTFLIMLFLVARIFVEMKKARIRALIQFHILLE